jgi:broad specificity phosphatase PhoE
MTEPRLYIVRTGETIWEQQDRMDNLAGVPLSEEGREQARRIGMELAPHEPTSIFASNGQSEQETARLIAEVLGRKVRTEPKLSELDYGLWQGLTREDIRRRQPSMLKQWLESPSGVRPSGGETLEEAQQRLLQALREILKKSKRKKPSPVLVLRPLAIGLLRCHFDHGKLDNVWSYVDSKQSWSSYTLEEVKH